MPWSSEHAKWFVNIGELSTSDGKTIDIWEFRHEQDEKVLSAWAKHFRNHYCNDSEIDFFCDGTSLSRAEYLTNMKFPDSTQLPGPSVRSGDFAEILVADFLEFMHQFWIPRTRYDRKTVPNESTKGSDIVGFFFKEEDKSSMEDTLAIFEAKAQFSGTKCNPRLQNAVDDSGKDATRKADSLNAIKQRLHDRNRFSEAKKIARFQCEADLPFKEVYGAVALFTNSAYDETVISATTSSAHPNKDSLKLLVIKGKEMMPLVHELYRRAADEA